MEGGTWKGVCGRGWSRESRSTVGQGSGARVRYIGTGVIGVVTASVGVQGQAQRNEGIQG